jgi:predicted metal-dependent enzyme (double-stranded beta helix superfamily)
MDLHHVVAPVIAGVSAEYGRKAVCRSLLTALALEIGALPIIRRMVADFGDRKKYPERPMLTLFDRGPSVYLLGWREGDFTDVHDHGASEVGISVVQGVVTEDLYAALPADGMGNRQCVLSISRQLRQGDVATCTESYIHRVGNIFPETAATLHVYGPALDDMNLYDLRKGVLTFKEHWHDQHRPQH